MNVSLSDVFYPIVIRNDNEFIEYDQDTIMNIAINNSIRGIRGLIVKVLDTPERIKQLYSTH